MNVLKLIFLVSLSALFQNVVIAQEWTSFQSQAQINDLVDTGDELLMATDIGLVVLDKTTLEKTFFNKSNSNLPSNHIQSITQAADGSTWIGTYDVIMAVFDGSNFEEVDIPANDVVDQNTHLYDLQIAPNGDVWIGTSDGVLHRSGQDWSFYDAEDIGPDFFEAWDMAINDDGEVFLASVATYQFVNGDWVNITESTNIENYLGSDLFFSSNGDLYMAGDLDKIGRYDGQQWESFEINFNGSEVVGLTEDTDGNIYFNAWRDGIFKLENDNWVNQSNDQTALFDNRNNYFYIDADNRQWLNTNIHLSVNDNGTIQSTLIAPHTLETNNLRKIHQGLDGNLYFITGSQDYFSMMDTEGNWSFLEKPASAGPFEFFYDLLAFAENDIWVASQAGLYHYTGSGWTHEALEPCRSFEMDSNGKVYVRSTNIIYVLENGSISEINSSNSSISALPITGHGVDSDDNLWIATGDFDEDNVIQMRSTDGTWTNYSAADHPIIDRPVGDFHFDNDGNAWIANDGIGAIKFDGTTFTNPFIGNIDQMANYRAEALEVGADGTVYFAHQYGVTTLKEGVFGDLLIEDVPPIATSNSTTIQFDDAGNLWWGSALQGVFSYSFETSSTTLLPAKSVADFSIYPNPAIQFTTIDFTIEENSNVQTFIYNQLGQLLFSKNLGEMPVGSFQETIDVNHFPKGIYNIQLLIDNNSTTKTIVIQ